MTPAYVLLGHGFIYKGSYFAVVYSPPNPAMPPHLRGSRNTTEAETTLPGGLGVLQTTFQVEGFVQGIFIVLMKHGPLTNGQQSPLPMPIK